MFRGFAATTAFFSSLLRIAQRRGVEVVQGVGEHLPMPDASLGAVLFITTLCFLDDPRAALREAVRALSPGGAVLVADIIADSPWGRFYLERKRSGHPFYAAATFYTLDELTRLLEDVGLRVAASSSTLVHAPETSGIVAEDPVRGVSPVASFVCLLARVS